MKGWGTLSQGKNSLQKLFAERTGEAFGFKGGVACGGV
jgi:hypothetical protein